MPSAIISAYLNGVWVSIQTCIMQIKNERQIKLMSKVTNDIYYIGVNDYDIDLFESQYMVNNGVTYNSYVIKDEKIMVVATTEKDFIDEWMGNLDTVLEGNKPDYLLIQHVEPDHSAAIGIFMEKYPESIIVASKPALNMVKNYFGTDYEGRNLVIKEGDVLNLGTHEICFVSAPMVHWPEVMLAYDKKDRVLFSSDAFGRFGAPDQTDEDATSATYEAQEWEKEAGRYYFGIVGKFGDSTIKALEKAKDLDIEIICSLHGPVLRHDLEKYFALYSKWGSYEPEQKGIAICYSSVYGHTKEAVMHLKNVLKELDKGINHCEPKSSRALKIEAFDLARSDIFEAIAAAFRYDRLILATTTYNNDIFPFMKHYIDHLIGRGFKKRKIGLIENGTWGPKAASIMKNMLDGCEELTFADNIVTIKGALNDASINQINNLAKEMI